MTEPTRPIKRVLRFVVSSALVSPLALGVGCEPDRRTMNPAPVKTPPSDPPTEHPVSKSPAPPTPPKKPTRPDLIVNTVKTLPAKPTPLPTKTPQPKPSEEGPVRPPISNPGPDRRPIKPKPEEKE